jgi:hypothetical protein
MRRVFSVLLCLAAGLILLSGVALSESKTLRPLPLGATGLPQTVMAKSTDQADLQRAGYTLDDKNADLQAKDRRERSYSFQGSLGSSALLVDNEYPSLAPIRRELVFDIRFTAKEGESSADMPGIAPRLIASMRKAVRQDPAIVAGLGYLATAAGSGVAPEALQTAVIDYMRQYRQPALPIQQVCGGCSSTDGFGDEYSGGPDMHTHLDVAEPGWTIAGTRHYANGDSVFTVQVTAKIPRSRT